MSKSLRFLRKIIVLIVGVPLLAVGVILIPLPGPGLLLCLAALIVLSLEFEFAKKYRDSIIGKLKDIIAQARQR